MRTKEEILNDMNTINAEQEEFQKYLKGTNLHTSKRPSGNINCNYLIECFNCVNCTDCFKCSDIKDSCYMIENIQFTKEEYIKFFKALHFNEKYKKELSLFRDRLYERCNHTHLCRLWFDNRPNTINSFGIEKFNKECIKEKKELSRQNCWNLFFAFCIITSVLAGIITVLYSFMK